MPLKPKFLQPETTLAIENPQSGSLQTYFYEQSSSSLHYANKDVQKCSAYLLPNLFTNIRSKLALLRFLQLLKFAVNTFNSSGEIKKKVNILKNYKNNNNKIIITVTSKYKFINLLGTGQVGIIWLRQFGLQWRIKRGVFRENQEGVEWNATLI